MSTAGTRKRTGTGRVGARSGSGAARPSQRIQGQNIQSRKRKQRPGWKGRVVLACAALVVGLVAWAAIARSIAPTANTTQNQFDVLIVLGSAADADGNPTPTELERVTEAVHEYERGVAPRMIITGGPAHNRFVEAEVMARVAEAQGIPAGAIVEERTARDTMENACDSLRIMRIHGWESAEVVSSASHLPRTGLILSRLPLEWRTHAAPALEPDGEWTQAAMTAVEILKTVHYLVWARRMDGCEVK
ncbi:MAG: YdcF family protein [Terracidiphilus sp.]